MKIFLSFIIFFTNYHVLYSTAQTKKKILFITHTETINGKGVYDFYSKLKSNGHKVKVVILPLFNGDSSILYDMDEKFASKFDKEDVVFPCGVVKPYERCEPLENFIPDVTFIQNPYDSSRGSIGDFFSISGLKKSQKNSICRLWPSFVSPEYM